jgi:RNA polymerase II subunit A small phosphatase-like protein
MPDASSLLTQVAKGAAAPSMPRAG